MRATRLPIAVLLGLGLATSTLSAVSAAPPPDDTVPTLSVTGVRWQKFYPAPDGYRDVDQVSYDLSDPVDTALDVHIQVTDATDTVVLDRIDPQGSPASTAFSWDGRDTGGARVPAGDYTVTLWASDAEGNESAPESRSLAVDEGRLVTRTFRTSGTPQQALVERDVRRCGLLKSPVRGWRGSLGYYANARCNASGVPSVAATVLGTRVPTAFRDQDRAFYKNIVVKTYGGNARQRPGAKGVLQYWNYAQQKWFAAKTMGSRIGTHAGRSKAANPMVVSGDGRPYVIWSMLTANGHWYDVKKFSVVLTYQVMKRPDAARRPVTGGTRLTAPSDVSVTAPSAR